MPLDCKIKTTHLKQDCGAEDAEALVAWLLATPNGSVNLKLLTHLHAAVLQVLMAFRPKISVLPQSPAMALLLTSAGLTD